MPSSTTLPPPPPSETLAPRSAPVFVPRRRTKTAEDCAADALWAATKVTSKAGWKFAKFSGRIARKVAGRAASAAAQTKPGQVAIELTDALLTPAQQEPLAVHKLPQRITREPHLEEQMAKDFREGKGCMFSFMIVISILLFTTTTFLDIPFIPFAGPAAGVFVLVITLGYMLVPAEVHIWYWRRFDKAHYEKARRAAERHLSNQT